jgi:hypothetical protein
VVSNLLTRRAASTRLFSVLAAMGLARRAAAITEAAQAADDEISRTCECIHQEVVINASPARVLKAAKLPPTSSQRQTAQPETMLGNSWACYTENPEEFVFVGTDDEYKVQLWIAEAR